MSNAKRITDLTDYKSILPYASELFGVYQPMIGWKSKRQMDRILAGTSLERGGIITRVRDFFDNKAAITFNADCAVSSPELKPADFVGPMLIEHDFIVLNQIRQALSIVKKPPTTIDEWRKFINNDVLTKILRTAVLDHYNQVSIEECRKLTQLQPLHETQEAFHQRLDGLKEKAHNNVSTGIEAEAVVAGALKALVDSDNFETLNSIFFILMNVDHRKAFMTAIAAGVDYTDPYLFFDPKKDVKDVSLSPLGIVHLFRQFFFELDTFLGTPQSHVWLSPGATVELVEVNTRRTITEKTVEVSTETVQKSETSTTDKDEISEAVKADNKDDLKLGATATVNQSWGTGNASATASLNMDKTQQTARETSHKRMREQSAKLSTEIRDNFKSTFKTVTEVTAMSSKRYVLANTTQKLINYELRRKMRQVGVQVQDVGSYLCWQTFVDEPGNDLGLASLIHIAEPPDLLSVPDTTQTLVPGDQMVALRVNGTWNFGKARQWGFVHVGVGDPAPPPDGMELVKQDPSVIIPAVQVSGNGEDFTGVWAFGARFTPGGQIEVGVITAPDGLSWNHQVDFVVGTALKYTVTQAKRDEIAKANSDKMKAATDATEANNRKTRESYIKAAKERVEFASSIAKRPYEDLREEERIIVYRRLIKSLMTDYNYVYADDRSRHVLSELINSIFDIDKMLYFVAPEWWKPRYRAAEYLSINDLKTLLDQSIVTWSDSRTRPDNYLITEKSAQAAMGSSLGWLLQLDGDSLRNAFLNAPWVKAVIPVRPGKEQAALHWLQNVNVEGADGLDANYEAPDSELDEIRSALGLGVGAPVTIKDAIDYLCQQVADKYAESNQVKVYPNTEINVDNKVTSTPVEKVYEHGFYPLQGGFRVSPTASNPDPNNTDTNYQVFDQWIEVLPTDQVVPVEVTYDPKTGRQL